MKLNKELLRMKEVLTKRLDDKNYDLQFAHVQQSVGELSNYDNHPGDHGTELYERQKDIALNEHTEKHLKDINQALKAIEDNKYGICEQCGQAIPFARLEAIPTATRCLDHTEENTVSRTRPVEEEILSPPFGKFDYDESRDGETFFDAEDTWQAVSVYGTSETPSDFLDTDKDYNNMFIESSEEIGYVEMVEDIAVADIEGNFSGVSLNHHDYEACMEEDTRLTLLENEDPKG